MEDAPPGALVGNPVSPGVVEGVVRVVHDPHTETLHPGEILVAHFTDPGWTPLFIDAAGRIMEVGGAMNHGSVVAREYGIPAVVGVRDATKKLRTGQRVRLDGNRGIIEILDEDGTDRHMRPLLAPETISSRVAFSPFYGPNTKAPRPRSSRTNHLPKNHAKQSPAAKNIGIFLTSF